MILYNKKALKEGAVFKETWVIGVGRLYFGKNGTYKSYSTYKDLLGKEK